MGGAINVRDLDQEDVEIVERLVERLREKARRRKSDKADGFTRSAGSWKNLLNGEEFKRAIYENRLVRARPKAEL